MKRIDILHDFIDNYPFDEPIFYEDIVNYLKENKEFKNNQNDLYVYLFRLVKDNKIKKFADGIYYKPSVGTFGERPLNINKVINRKYLFEGDNIKGYYTGHYLFSLLGLTTQMPNIHTIVTNECPNKNQYKNEKLKVLIRKPKIEVNNDNYLYLQLLDVLTNKDKINIEVTNEKEIIYDFIKQNNLNLEKIMYYAKLTKSKNAIERLYDIAC